MYRNHTVAVVVPAYNEEGFVGETIDTVPTFVDRIYVVDDGSTDGTWEEINEHAARTDARRDGQGSGDVPDHGPGGGPGGTGGGAVSRNGRNPVGSEVDAVSRDGVEGRSRRVVPIQHEANRGVGGAIKTGYQRSLEDGVDITVVMGGDGQMEPELMPKLLDPIVDGRADYVKGNRLVGRADHGDMPRFRFVGNTILSVLTKVASGYWQNGDPQSGYTAISREALDRVTLDEMYEGYGYCNDLLVRLNVAQLRVVDVPRPITYGDEQSDIVYSEYIPRVSALLFVGFLRRLLRRYVLDEPHPVALLYAGGGVSVGAGGAAFVRALFDDDTAAGVRRSVGALGLGLLFALAAVRVDQRLNADISTRDAGTPPKDLVEHEDEGVTDAAGRNGESAAPARSQ